MWGASFLCALVAVQAAPQTPTGVHLRSDHPLSEKNFRAAQSQDKPKIGKAGEEKSKWNPFAPAVHHASSDLMCGITVTVDAHTDKYEDCPATCPYFAQNRKDTEHCTFLCVPGSECGRWNPNKPIPDSIKNSKTCRGPKVAFCKEPVLDGEDNCQRCQSGFALSDGQCYFQHWTAIIIITLIFVVLITLVIVWLVDFCCRANINQGEVARCEAWRSRSKILMPRTEGQMRRTFPIETNMCTTDVAGPGMMLHFNFQAFFIFWPLVCAIVWTVIACFHNELFILGTRKFGTPRHNCILVAWGYETQQRLMWTKVLFLVIVYIFSFISFLLFSIRQLRLSQRLDANEKTMKDFALELKGLPALPGNRAEVEKDLQSAVEAATGKTLVGVSVAWNYGEVQDSIDAACSKDQVQREIELSGVSPSDVADEPEPTAEMGAVHTWLYNKEKDIFGPDEEKEEDMKAMLENLVSSDSAFLVFNTSEDRDSALSASTEIKFDATKYGFEVKTLTMEEVTNEPMNVNWHNFGDSDPTLILLGFLKGFFKVYVPALAIWFFGFYVPYAYSLYNFNYDNGAELPGYYSFIFTIIICGGNATMYVVCDVCCDIIGFRYKDTKQATYMLMYLLACMFNVVLDMVVTYYAALKIMVGLDFRTYHGVRLAEIDTFTEQFETYAMQRSLGENTYRYAWPSTFFLCFVLEPFVTIVVPFHIGKVVIRSHSEVKGPCAEAYLAAFEFDLGRYADILLNVFLGILIFFFPGGYIWTLFFAMAFSHTFIYCFDHYRVLKVIPAIKIVSTNVDWWAQVMMCACCAVILSCLVFKANCETYVNYCLQDVALVGTCSFAAIVHFIVHFLLLLYFVPTMGQDLEDENGGMTFESAARDESKTWFSTNPVHCLRSQHIHGDKPYCRLASWGKEHFLEVNAKIGCHFSDEAAEAEDFHQDLTKSMSGMSEGLSNIRKSMSRGSQDASP